MTTVATLMALTDASQRLILRLPTGPEESLDSAETLQTV
jgi:hypothetical protein